MGYKLKATCSSCNLQEILVYGGDRLNYLKEDYVPAINIKTKAIESVNYIKYKNDSRYQFYTNNSLKEKNKYSEIIKNCNLELNSKYNYCPNCRTFNLDFQIESLFD